MVAHTRCGSAKMGESLADHCVVVGRATVPVVAKWLMWAISGVVVWRV